MTSSAGGSSRGTKSERILRMIIRERSPGDGEALEAIALETHRRDGYPKYLPKDLRSFIVRPEGLGAWVAVSDGQVVGHVALHPHGNPQVVDLAVSVTGLDKDDVAVVGRLFIAPSARRQGIGRALLERATEAAVGLGRRAVLDVVEGHSAAIELYEACGWALVGRVYWELPGGLPLRELVYLSPERSP
jgi:GNAT superfamily N-acetyltransferase